MKLELLKNNYMVVPGFIDLDYAKRLEQEFIITDAQFEFDGDEQAPNSASCFMFHPAVELLCNKTGEVSELIGETVLPTYTYSRIYHRDSVLKKHTDRPACEVSMTVHLGGDKPWAIWIETPENEKKCVTLNPGDAMLYLGCVAPHWRTKFDGDQYAQIFLHYVRSRGLYGCTYFDRIRTEAIEDHVALKQEYETMRSRFEHVNPRAILPKKYREQEEPSIDIVREDNDIDDYVDFDNVVVANSKYEKFLKKKDTPEIQTKVKTLSSLGLEHFIWHGEEFIDPDFCDKLLEEYAPTNYWEKTLTGNGHDPQARKCEFIPISDQGVIEEENEQERREIDNYLFDIVKDIIEQYQQQHPEFELEIQEDSGYELLKYEVGDFYIQHSDSFKQEPRALTVIMSMNDGYEGGEVALFNRELVYKLGAGDILVFPSNFMYPHEIMPVTDGTRYSIITWVV
jgi:hypothetical protein